MARTKSIGVRKSCLSSHEAYNNYIKNKKRSAESSPGPDTNDKNNSQEENNSVKEQEIVCKRQKKSTALKPHWETTDKCDKCVFLGTIKEMSGDVIDMWICIKDDGTITSIRQYGPSDGDFGSWTGEGYQPLEYNFIQSVARNQGIIDLDSCKCYDRLQFVPSIDTPYKCNGCDKDISYVKR